MLQNEEVSKLSQDNVEVLLKGLMQLLSVRLTENVTVSVLTVAFKMCLCAE